MAPTVRFHLWYDMTTPLGRPVDPDVYMMVATSEGSCGRGAMGRAAPAAARADIRWSVTPAACACACAAATAAGTCAAST